MAASGTATTLSGRAELRRAQSVGLPLAMIVALFSAAVNLLMLTGPIFMLQVYDRVLAARSTETLRRCTLLMTFLFVAMGLVDLARGRIVQRVAARFQSRLEARVFDARRCAKADARRRVAGAVGACVIWKPSAASSARRRCWRSLTCPGRRCSWPRSSSSIRFWAWSRLAADCILIALTTANGP